MNMIQIFMWIIIKGLRTFTSNATGLLFYSMEAVNGQYVHHGCDVQLCEVLSAECVWCNALWLYFFPSINSTLFIYFSLYKHRFCYRTYCHDGGMGESIGSDMFTLLLRVNVCAHTYNHIYTQTDTQANNRVHTNTYSPNII